MKPRVVIAEDEALIRMTLRMMLEEAACEVVGETSVGSEVAALVEAKQPDLVFLDIKLRGDVTGLDAASAINRISQAQIVFMSAFRYAERIAALGVERVLAFLPKPFGEDDVKKTIALLEE